MPLGASRLLTLANPGVAAGPAQRTAVSVTAYGDTRVDSQEAYFGGSAAKFDGTGDYLNASLAVDTEIGTGATTWECWFFVAADAGAGTVAVLSNRNGGASNGEVQMLFRNFDMKIQVNGYGTGAFSANGVGSALSTNTWHHYVWARDDSGSWAIWVNGTRVGNGTGYTQSLTNDGGFGIGAHADGGIPINSGTVGRIDEVRVSNTDRYGVSNTSITVPTGAFANDENTILLLHMDGYSDATNADFTDDNGNRTPIVPDRVVGEIDTAQSKFGGSSYYFNSQYNSAAITMNNGGNRQHEVLDDISATSAFTIEFFARRGTNTSGDEGLLYGNNNVFNIYYDGSAEDLKYQTEGIDRITGSALSTNTWYHIAVVRDTSYNVKMYIDGTQTGSTYTNDDRNWATLTSIIIGGDGTSPNWHMDELRISNTQRYTTNFTAPTSAFTDDEFTLLLYHFDDTDGAKNIKDDNGAS